jgi:hypothetical protein
MSRLCRLIDFLCRTLKNAYIYDMKKRPMRRKLTSNKDKMPISYRRERKYNFLKYWRIVRYHTKKKYNLSEADLEMLLFLYDEERFTKQLFDEFANTMKFDYNRFRRFMDMGYVREWRKKDEVPNRKAIYELTVQAKTIVNNVYRKLLGLEGITEDPARNPIMKGETYTDKVYRMAIRKMNASR